VDSRSSFRNRLKQLRRLYYYALTVLQISSDAHARRLRGRGHFPCGFSSATNPPSRARWTLRESADERVIDSMDR